MNIGCLPISRCFLIAAGDSGRDSICELVSAQENACIHLAHTFREFIDQVESREFEAVLIDVLFDGGKMFETLKEARQLRADTPIVCFRPVWSPLAHSCDRVIENAITMMYPNTVFWDLSSIKGRRRSYAQELESLICPAR